MNESKVMQIIRKTQTDYKLLNWLNWKNHKQNTKLILAELDEITGELLNEKESNFKVGSCKWFYFGSEKKGDIVLVELLKIHRFKNLLFLCQSITLSHGTIDTKTKHIDTDLDSLDNGDYQGALKFESYNFETSCINFESKVINLLSYTKLMKFVETAKPKESRQNFNKIFKQLLHKVFEDEIGYENSEGSKEWYFDKDFF